VAKLLDKVLVVDVESTCWEGDPPRTEVSEIIEIGVCLLDVHTLDRQKNTSIMVKPTRSKVSPFCTKLTTLTQADVDKGMSFVNACDKLEKEYSSAARTWASYGDYDRSMFERQCRDMRVRYPFGKTHLNVKNLFALQNDLKREVGMDEALKILNFDLDGTHHRGGDDAWNIAVILKSLLFAQRPISAVLVGVQKEADPLGSTAMVHIAYFVGTPTTAQLEKLQHELYGETPSEESGFKIQRIKSTVADAGNLEAWYMGQVI
jgi:inhibitor of KinA sporulation pathway (predicted exonuclease)